MNKKWEWLLWIGLTVWLIAIATEAGGKFAVNRRLARLEQRLDKCQCPQ